MSTTTLPEALATDLVTAATAAPSMYNIQPWRFRVRGATIELYADPTRMLSVGDPQGRALHLGCGAALLNLRVAATYRGREPVVRLLPDPAVPTLLAAVRLVGRSRAGPFDRRLYEAIWLRRTNRLPFAADPVPDAVLRELADGAALEGAAFRVLTEPWRSEVLARIATADRARTVDPEYRRELAWWDATHQRHREGIPAQPGTTAEAERPGEPARPGKPTEPSTEFSSAPELASLNTPHDRPADWLRAGQALERVLLLATVHGLSASYLQQPLEHPDLGGLLHDPEMGMDRAQVLLRLGYGAAVPSPPRRPLHEVLQQVPDRSAGGG